ncbi:MAG: cysteine--tRNA ligase, partial [Dehalococcoidia bacterium]
MLRIHNTLSKRIDPFVPREPGVVRMYTCGPTVYRHAHLGNLRTYLMADWVRRALEQQGHTVTQVKNITDVGHMRQELLERGGDKIILAALAEGKTPQEIAQFYTEAFLRDEALLNILPAHQYPRASEHIPEMLAIVQRLVERGYAYEVAGTIYFDVGRFPAYGQLSGNTGESLMEAVRGEADPQKRDPRDFTLWKAAEPGREVKWPSPWGEGFPGWHIECSAMSTKYLGEQLDLHTGGVDNIFPHHENEIAQSEAAFGVPFVRHWLHGQHLLADGVKMAKSAANDYTLDDLNARGYDPMAFRYLCLTVRSHNRLNFTFSSLRAAEKALYRLRHRVWEWFTLLPLAQPIPAEGEWRARFWDQVNDDLNLPGALTLVWAMLNSDLPDQAKLKLLLEFDRLLGLGLDRVPQEYQAPPQITRTLEHRSELRQQGHYQPADQLREEISRQAYMVEDTTQGSHARPKTPLEQRLERWPAISSPREVPWLLDLPATVDFSAVVVACNYLGDVQRCFNSLLRHAGDHDLEVLVVDNGSTDGTAQWLEETSWREPRLRVCHTDHVLGEGAAKNTGLKQARGRVVLILDTSVEVTGDLLAPLARHLQDPSVGIVGPWGLHSSDLHHFHEVEAGEADAMQAYCMALRRETLQQAGLMRETFRFYRNLDLDFSFQVKAVGYRIVADASLPLVRHEHRVWTALGKEEREALSRKNFRRFTKR